jgi:GH15 family glucan-1,4-alpha-glucosidase
MCWVAVDRGAKLAAARGDAECAARWREAAEEIHADVCARGVDGRGVFVQHLGNYPQAFTHLALIDAVTQLIELETTESAPGPGGAT